MNNNNLQSFLESARWTDGDQHTHTCFYKKVCKLSITDVDKLFELYVDHLENDPDATTWNSLTEKVTEFFNFFVDVDFDMTRFRTTLMEIVETLYKETVEEAFGPGYDCVVAVRNKYKAHLHFPGLVVTQEQAKALRSVVLAKLDAMDLKDSRDDPIDWEKSKIIDATVYSTGLRLLGSHKGKMDKKGTAHLDAHKLYYPDEPYQDRYMIRGHDSVTEDDLRTCSILTNQRQSTPFTDTFLDKVRSLDEKKPVKKARTTTAEIDTQAVNQDNIGPDNDLYSAIIRATKEVLNREMPHILTDVVDVRKFSNSPNYRVTLAPQKCPILGGFHRRTSERNTPANYLVVGSHISLHCWKCTTKIEVGRTPDDEAQVIVPNFRLLKMLDRGTDHDCADYIVNLIGNHFAYSDKVDYVYRTEIGVWRPRASSELREAIANEDGPVQCAFKEDTRDMAGKEKKIAMMIGRLQNTRMLRDSILPNVRDKLNIKWKDSMGTPFGEQLNQRPDLLVFKNGTMELPTGTFRESRPADKMSMSTNHVYVPWEETPENIKEELTQFLAQIFVDEYERSYVMQELASSLDGSQIQQRFFIFTGRGSNGKSTLFQLIQKALGDYADSTGVAMFTQTRGRSEAPDSALMKLKGKRIVSTSEPDSKDVFNMSIIKEYSGGDTVTARELYQSAESFRLQATFYCLCNDIPQINARVQDHGTWRRIRLVSFKSKFLANPDPENPYEFPVATENMSQKLDRLAPAFVSYLVEVYRYRKDIHFDIPHDFNALHDKLTLKSDIYGRYVREMAEPKAKEFIFVKPFYDQFGAWKARMGIKKHIDHDTFVTNVSEIMGDIDEEAGEQVWRGYKPRFQADLERLQTR